MKAEEINDWFDFDNYFTDVVIGYYRPLGKSNKEITTSIPFRIGSDLTARIGIAAGYVRAPSYRGEIEGLVRDGYRNRKAFCDATGLSESQLSHVLHNRKNLAIDTLEEALSKIGYRIKIVPMDVKPPPPPRVRKKK